MGRKAQVVLLADLPEPKPRSRFGNWSLRRQTAELVHRPTQYAVDLERCLSAAEVLDWIAQLGKKGWLTDRDFRDLFRLLDEVLDIQGNLCSFGHEPPDAMDRVIGRLLERKCKLSLAFKRALARRQSKEAR